ncbi:hypothetical protein LJR221_004084 [Agrobacterium tumefaciens]
MKNIVHRSKAEMALKLLLDDLCESAANARVFGPVSALTLYGRRFPPATDDPTWLERGPKRHCFANAAKLASERDDVFYAEGYAFNGKIPIPMQHAWLVDENGYPIDPTWEQSPDHIYFGIVFRAAFITEMMKINGCEDGLLVYPDVLRRHFGSPELLEAVIEPSV